MKIAIPTRDGRVDDHFGHCGEYTIFSVDNKQIISKETLPSPQGCGCKSGIAGTLQQMGVTMMLAGNIGTGAIEKLNAHNIRIIRGCSGSVEDTVAAFIASTLTDSGLTCAHHECH